MFFDWNGNGKKNDAFDDAMDFMLFEETVADDDKGGDGGSGKRGGCYIATCVYGSYDCPAVWTLRRFRDNVLQRSAAGRAFVRLYYAVSPSVVRWCGNARWFRHFWHNALDKLVARLRESGVRDTPYQDQP